ncbi:hypothetical protein BCR35DRAFT_334869 [Leucosporidium creatinivorum]|uniref:DUF6534 domain-containing protein n=1 Tax=Leucosporidium creatinivorum TaxID=106004 RepID=A0A1Y2DVQ3_9BASI|nr:hypothetical protein BCR35DRAFT_334869 [Leucosporidium creatinivorum]
MGLYDSSVGAFVLGAMLDLFHALRGNDKRIFFWTVVFLTAWDWAHSAISVYTIYYWCVQNYSNPAILVKSPWSFTIEPAMTGVASIVAQTFYAHRVYVVSKRKPWMPAVILAISVVACGFSIGATAEIFNLESEFSRFQQWTYGVATWLASAAFADVLITGSLIYYLQQSQSQFVATNNIIDKLVENVISTNGFTALIAVIDTILFAASSESWHVIPQLCLVKLYFNSLLVSLNARIELERQLSNGGGVSSGGGQVSLTTPLGFGAEDVRPSFWKRSKSGKNGAGGKSRTDFASQIHVETLRTNVADTFVELGDMNNNRTVETDYEKGEGRHVQF